MPFDQVMGPGHIASVKLSRDFSTKVSRGFGHVDFLDQAKATEAGITSTKRLIIFFITILLKLVFLCSSFNDSVYIPTIELVNALANLSLRGRVCRVDMKKRASERVEPKQVC